MNFEAFINISGNSSGAQSAINGVGNAAKNAGANIGSFLKNLTNLSHINNQVRANVNSANNALMDFNAALKGLAFAKLATEVYKVRNQFIGWENQLSVTTGTTQKAQIELEKLIGVVKELGTDLTTSVTGFTQLNVAAQGSGLSSTQLLDIFKSFSGALSLFNADTLKVEGTFRALTQMFSKGTVQAEELRGQLSEHLPGALQLAARAIGKTTWELQEMMRQGLVVPSDLITKMADQIKKELGPAILRSMETPRAAYNRLVTDVKLLFNKIGEAFEKDFINITDTIASVIKSITALFKESSGAILTSIHLLGGYAAAWITVATAVGLVTAALALARAQATLFGLAATASPWGRAISLIITGLGLLAGALYDARERVAEFNGTSATIGNWAQGALEEARPYFEYMASKFSELKDKAIEYVIALSDINNNNAYDESTFFGFMNKGIIDLGKGVIWLIGQLLNLVNAIFQLTDSSSKMSQAFDDAFNTAIENVKEFVSLIVDTLITALSAIPGLLQAIVIDIANVFTGDTDFSNIKEAWAQVTNTIATQWEGVTSTIAHRWDEMVSNFKIKVDFDWNWSEGIVARFTSNLEDAGRRVAATAGAAYQDYIAKLLNQAELAAVANSLNMTPEEFMQQGKEFQKIIEDVMKSTAESKKETALYKKELELLRTNGIEATNRALVTYTADLEYAAKVQALVASGVANQVNGERDFADALNRLQEARRLSIENGNLEIDVQNRRNEVQKSERSTTRSARPTLDLAAAVYKLKEAYDQLVIGISNLDTLYREHDILTAKSADNSKKITSAYTDITNSIRDLGTFSADVLAEFDRIGNIDLRDKLIRDLNDLKTAIDSATESGIDISIPVEFTFEGEFDPKTAAKSMVDEALANQQNTVHNVAGAFDEATDSVSNYNSTLDNGVERISRFDAANMRISSTLDYIKTDLKGTATAVERQAAAAEQVTNTTNELIRLKGVINQLQGVKESQGYLTGVQVTEMNRNIDLADKAFQKLESDKRKQREADLELIHSGKQVNWSFKLTTEQLQAVGNAYDSAASRMRNYTEAIANINQALQRGELTQFEATMAKVEEDVKNLSPIARDIGDAFDVAFESIITGSASASDAVKQMLKDIAAAIYKEFVSKQIVSWIGKLFSSFGFETGGVMTKEGPAELTKNAFGNIMTSMGPVDLRRYASGGIANKTQLAMFGEGSQPEAYVPLPDGRTIPVTIKGDNSQSSNANSKQEVKVIVNNLPGQNADVKNDGQGTLTIEIVRSALASDVNKGGVPWVGAMERRYGMNRGFAR